jgi:hypothetical protein
MHIVISLSKEKKQIKTLYLSQTFQEASLYVQDLKSITVDDNLVNITAIRQFPPKEDDLDGYYLINDDFSIDQFELYRKRTIVNKGYLYNSADLEIKEIMTIFITSCDLTTPQLTPNPIYTPQLTPSAKITIQNKQNGDLINRSVYNDILRQMIEKSKLIDKKCN